MQATELEDFARRYTAAWCSQDAASVAAFFAPGGMLTINRGAPSVGRVAITASAEGFMVAFPDLEVEMDGLDIDGDRVVYRWTLHGTNTGPDGTGRRVRIKGSETWTMGADGLVATSVGTYDAADYERQLHGAPAGA
jgi:uncharacterized protein (TIGR02246 family)